MKTGTRYTIGRFTAWECIWTDGVNATLAFRTATGDLYGCLSVRLAFTHFEEAR
jgi:hypothetical protein